MRKRALAALAASAAAIVAGCGADVPSSPASPTDRTPAAEALSANALQVPGTTSFTWAAAQSDQITVQRPLDGLSATLVQAVTQGTTLQRVTLPVVTPAGARLSTIVLRDVIVTSYQVSGQAETVTFVASRIAFL